VKSVETHISDLVSLGPLGSPRRMAAVAAVGCRLAADVTAATALPPFASSALDGYAVRVQDVPGRLVVVDEVAAGVLPSRAVRPGEAVRVMTGSVLPEGTQAVVGVEQTDGGTVSVDVRCSARSGDALRPAGSDVAAGEVVVAAGRVLGPAQLAAVLSAGCVEPLVWPRPRVLVVSTGRELVQPGAVVGPASLVDSNRPALLAAVVAAGGQAVDGGVVGDEEQTLLEVLDRLAPEVDLVITTGGVSMGAYDVVKAALAPRGVRFERVAMQPGMPQAWGRLGATAYVGLPGNPVSALVSFEVLVRPLLGRPRQPVRARLSEAIGGSPVGKTQFVRARLGAAGTVLALGGSGSHQLVGLARADALVVVPEGVSALPVGAEVDVLSLESP
jgi:molybdopterin molybdotransferase